MRSLLDTNVLVYADAADQPLKQQRAIALITALWCLTLCAFAERIAARVRAHARIGLALQRLAGLCMIGFGLRLLRS